MLFDLACIADVFFPRARGTREGCARDMRGLREGHANNNNKRSSRTPLALKKRTATPAGFV